MTHVSCPECQVRFTPAQSAGLPSCPTCGGALATLTSPRAAIGLALFEPGVNDLGLPEAVSASVPLPDPRDDQV